MSEEDKASYSATLEQLFLARQTPLGVSTFPHICGCQSQSCIADIEKEYEDIRSCLIAPSDALPRRRAGVEKDWWTPELTQLKDQSVAIHQLWLNEDRPRQGTTYLERLRVRAAYKNALRQAKKAPKQAAWNRLHSAMATQDTDSFWKWWRSIYNKNKSQLSPVVDGHSSRELRVPSNNLLRQIANQIIAQRLMNSIPGHPSLTKNIVNFLKTILIVVTVHNTFSHLTK